MTLIATIAATGKDVESFTTPPDIWAQWRKHPIGTFVIGRHRTPAVLKRSPRGLQFLAAAPGYAERWHTAWKWQEGRPAMSTRFKKAAQRLAFEQTVPPMSGI